MNQSQNKSITLSNLFGKQISREEALLLLQQDFETYQNFLTFPLEEQENVLCAVRAGLSRVLADVQGDAREALGGPGGGARTREACPAPLRDRARGRGGFVETALPDFFNSTMISTRQ